MKVRITLAILKKLNACRYGIKDALPMLPCVISTDPDENIELAMAFTENLIERLNFTHECARSHAAARARWLAQKFGVDDRDLWVYEEGGGHFTGDPLVIAQILAMAADSYLTARGR